MSWIDPFLSAYNAIRNNGTPVQTRQVIDFTGSATVTDDPNSTPPKTIVDIATPGGFSPPGSYALALESTGPGTADWRPRGPTLVPTGTPSDAGLFTTAFAAADEVWLGPGSFKFAADHTLGGAGQTIRFMRGAEILPAAGVTVTYDADGVQANDEQQIFNTSAGGSVVFGANAPKDVAAGWFGSDGTAIQLAHDALYDKGIIRTQEGGTTVAATIAVSKPLLLDISRGGLTAATGCQEVIRVNGNLEIAGLHRAESVITPLAGYPAVLAAGTWQQTGDTKPALRLSRVACAGGTSLLDMTTSTFNEGQLDVSDCSATGTTDYAIKLPTSAYYGALEQNYFSLCRGGVRMADNTETKCRNNVIATAAPVLHAGAASITSASTALTLAGLDSTYVGDTVRIVGAGAAGVDLVATILGVSGSAVTLDTAAGASVTSVDAYTAGFAYLLEGCHHVDIHDDEVYGFRTVNADIRITSTANAANGIVTIDGVKCGAERDYWLRDRNKIELYSPTNQQLAVLDARLTGCRVYGSPLFLITSIGGDGAHATATISTPNSALGHGLEVGYRITIVQCADTRFNGDFTVTAIGAPGTSQTVSWVSTVNVAQSNQAGFIANAQRSAIGVRSPFAGLVIEGNAIEGFRYAVDETAAVTDQTRGAHGRGIYRNNTELNVLGLPCDAMKSGFGRGFAIVEPGLQAMQQLTTAVPRTIETAKLQNRVLYSEDSTQWGTIGVTLTAGQTDAFGGTTATRLTRAGTNPVMSVLPGPGATFAELVSIQIDNTSLGGGGYLCFWAKAGTLDRLWVCIGDGTSGFLLPGSQRIVTLDSTWRHYRIPFGIPSNHGTIGIALCPGAFDPEAGTCYLGQVQVSDLDCDYVKTTGTSFDDTTIGFAIQRDAAFGSDVAIGGNLDVVGTMGTTTVADLIDSGLTASQAVVTDGSKKLASLAYTTSDTASTLVERDANSRIAVKGLLSSGSAPTPADTGGTLGTGGTYSMLTGSNSMAGTVSINPGTGAGAYVIFTLTFPSALPGNKPSILFQLESAGSNWSSGSLTGLSNVDWVWNSNTIVTVFAKNLKWDGAAVAGVNLVAGSDQYRINYQVVCT